MNIDLALSLVALLASLLLGVRLASRPSRRKSWLEEIETKRQRF